MRWTQGLILAALAALPAFHAFPQDDAGCQDHPLVARLPGYNIDSCDQRDFDSYEFTAGEDQDATVEGKLTEIKYLVTEGTRAPSELQVLRNYTNAIRQAGGEVVWTDERAKGTARFLAGDHVTWMEVRAHDQGEAYDLVFVEQATMAQEVTAGDMSAALDRDGHVALYILFDFGKATVRPESIPILDQIAAVLSQSPALEVSVEGHTDSVGSAETNQALSEQRAKAVVAGLVERGISAGRLSAVGHGLSQPVADNATEEGRARNRRDELVKR